MIIEDFMRENGMDPADYVELTCPTKGCRKPQIAHPSGDGSLMQFDQCPCGFLMLDQPKARFFFFAFGAPPFWTLVHRDDAPREG